MMSPKSARLSPTPAAGPFTAETSGTRRCGRAATSGFTYCSSTAPTSSSPASIASARCARLAPEQKPRPAPVRMAARTAGFASRLANTSSSSAPMVAVNAFNEGGSFKVMRATPFAAISTWTMSSLMAFPLVVFAAACALPWRASRFAGWASRFFMMAGGSGGGGSPHPAFLLPRHQ